jgi:hypothetical protein
VDQNDPSAAAIYKKFTERWHDAERGIRPSVKAIYEISLPKKYNKRFQDAISRGDSVGGFTTITTWYGGQCLCDLGANASSSPELCNWPGCSICVAVKKGFDVVEFGNSSYNGTYGPGIYTKTNPADAHPFTVLKANNSYRALIACGVVVPVRAGTSDKRNPVMEDQQGRVWCGSKDSVLPKYVIIYSVPGNN